MKYLLSILMLFVLFGCYYDSAEGLYGTPGVGCDTTVTNFGTEVKPILQSYCISCHSNSAAIGSGGGIKLQDYADVKTYADNGKLMGTINHSSGYLAMPKGGGKLTDCEILKIQTWITRGTLNN